MKLPESRLVAFLGHWEFAAGHHLTASDAESLTIAELLDLAGTSARQVFEELSLGYTPTSGTPPLLDAIGSTYERITPEHVLPFAGAQEAMFWTLQEIVGPGDHAVVTVPSYPSIETVIVATGADVDGLPLRPEQSWALDLAELERLLRPQTRLVAINFPNNPTGAVPDSGTFARLLELCEERGIRLFSDEIFRGLELDPQRRLPQAADRSDTAVSLNGMSKAYGLPGVRIAWIACRERSLLDRLERRKTYTSMCNAVPSEHLATLALQSREQILARNRGIIEQNIPVFERFFARWPDHLAWEAPRGGCVSFPALLTGEPTSSFCRRLVEEAGVVLLPADVYHSDLAQVPTDRFRIGVGRRDPEPALAQLDRFLRSDDRIGDSRPRR